MARYDPAMLTTDSVVSTWAQQAETTYPGWLYSGAALRVLGMGGSYNAAAAAAPRLRALGVDVRVELASGYYRGSLKALGAADTLVLVSTSGESVELVELAQRLRANGFRRTIAVVQDPSSPLALLCEHVLPLGILDEQPIDSFVATAMVLARLGAAVLGEPAPDIEADALAIGAAVGSGQTRDHGSPASYVDVLGRGALWGAARQAALLFREIARVPAAAFDANDFRHGPMESVHADQMSIILCSIEESTRAVDLGIARDLRAIPNRALVVGHEPSQAPDIVVSGGTVLPGATELAALIPTIYAWARAASVEPGTFRYTRMTITEDE